MKEKLNKVHIVVGDHAADNLKAAFESVENVEDEIFIVKDVFNVGPLRSEEMPFSQLRATFWQEVTGENDIEVKDLEHLMELSTRLTNDEVQQVWFWMAGIPADVCTYFWLLHFLKKHMGKLFVVNIAGLPFLDDEGKLFYPDSIANLPTRQVVKALKLARAISPSEWETDGDEWKRLIHEEGIGIRINNGAKQLSSKAIDFYDKQLLGLAVNNNQKISKLIGNAMSKFKIYTGDTFLIWRLKQLAAAQHLSLSKDSVKLFAGTGEASTDMFEDSNEGEDA